MHTTKSQNDKIIKLREVNKSLTTRASNSETKALNFKNKYADMQYKFAAYIFINEAVEVLSHTRCKRVSLECGLSHVRVREIFKEVMNAE